VPASTVGIGSQSLASILLFGCKPDALASHCPWPARQPWVRECVFGLEHLRDLRPPKKRATAFGVTQFHLQEVRTVNRLFWQLLVRNGITTMRRSRRRLPGRMTWARFQPQLQYLESRTLLTTFTVVNTNDSGTGSLRYYLGQAQNGDTINFDPSLTGGTINLASYLAVNTSVTIQGLGAGNLAINGQGNDIFHVGNGLMVVLSGLTLTGGGYGILMENTDSSTFGSQLSLAGCDIVGNAGPGLDFGNVNVDSPGMATLNGCSVNDNGEGVTGYYTAELTAISSVFENNQSDGIDFFSDNQSSIGLAGCTLMGNQDYGVNFLGSGTGLVVSYKACRTLSTFLR
jgi:hypothetical protein